MKKFPINRYNVIIPILAIALTALTALGFKLNVIFKEVREGKQPYKYTEGKEDEFFPYDEEEAEAIEDSEPSGDGETWAIYMYLNGSNLELNGQSQLSSFVKTTVEEQVSEREAEESKASSERLDEYIATEDANSIPMPLSFYDADYEDEEESALPEESKTKNNSGWGSDILKTLKENDLPDNFTLVVQPGGAKAWKDPLVNPNRTRRFVKDGDELKEVYDAPVSNMGESETLADFLKFCKKNYPADHTMVILVDHGGAVKGFGWDYVYGDDNLTLKELTEAFDMAYGTDEEDPPIDLLYFNACLMSNTDVINSMRGVAKYMVAGEEVGLSLVNYYGKFFEKLCDDPDVNAEQLGKHLIDSYTADLTETCAMLGDPRTSGLCLLDMSKAPLVYDAYAMFAKNVLSTLADDPEILNRFSKAVGASVNFAVNQYKSYNVTDLGLWAEDLSDLYPKETEALISMIDDAVIYKRADSYLKDAHGISVYFPNYIETTGALNLALDYIDNISYSEDISALYYYKVAGCLNDKYKSYCREQGIEIPEKIDYASMENLRNTMITDVDGAGNVSCTISDAAESVVMDVRYELCKVDEADKTVTCYGEDRFVNFDEADSISTEFEGKWIEIGGTRLYVDVINWTDQYIMYESPVIYKDFEYKLIIKEELDKETEDSYDGVYTIEGLRAPSDEAATIDRNVIKLNPGSYITPIYEESSLDGGKVTEVNGSPILYNTNTRIADGKLEDGKYRVRLVFEDMRGDDVYSAPVYFDVK